MSITSVLKSLKKRRNFAVSIFVFFVMIAVITSTILNYSKKEKLETLQLSSFAEKLMEVRETEYETINRLSDQQVLIELEKSKVMWSLAGKEEFSLSPEEIEKIEKRHKKKLPKRFKDNPAFQLFEQLNNLISPDAQVNPEELTSCDQSRLVYEKQLEKTPSIKELFHVDENNNFEAKLSRKCIAHVMNKFTPPSVGYADCGGTSGNPKISGAKPCATEKLVNLTYNSYMNVMDCLSLDPKFLVSKLEFESGFLNNSVNLNKFLGLGQLTRAGISEVNKQYEYYLQEVEKAAVSKPSCAVLMQHKSLLTRATEMSEQKCSMIGLPENPLRNFFYLTVLNKINLQKLEDAFNNNHVSEKLARLGIKNPDAEYFKTMLSLAALNIGVPTTVNIFVDYLDKRIEKKLSLTTDDFDFGYSRDSVNLARDYVMSSFIGPKDTTELKLEKAKKRKEFPRLWASSFTKPFPEHLALRANTYDGTSSSYSVLGFPGYMNLIAERNASLRMTFEKSDLDPNLCSDPNFLKIN